MLTRNPRNGASHTAAGAATFSATEMAALDSINAKVGAADSVDEIIRYVFESTKRFCPCDRVGFALLEDDGRHLVTKSAFASYEPVMLGIGYSADVGEGSLRKIIDEGQPRIIGDLVEYLTEHPRSESTRLLVQEGVRSSLTCPLVVKGRAVGVLFRSSRKPHAYSQHHVRLHLAIADRLSQAVEKTCRIEQLDAARRSYGEILSFVSHELKNSLAGVLGDVWSLRQNQAGGLTPGQMLYVERLEAKADYLLKLTREYLDLGRLQDDELAVQMQEVDFEAEVIRPAIDMSRSQLEQQRMQLKLVPGPSVPQVSCDADLMKIAMDNLVTNAIKYGREGGMIRIRWEQAGDTFRVYVYNEGPGFPPEQRTLLFRRFSRIQTPELLGQPGTGIGLHNTWRILQLHGGRVAADSQPGRWAEFCLELPLSVNTARGSHGGDTAQYVLLSEPAPDTTGASFGPRDTEAWDSSFADITQDAAVESGETAGTQKRVKVLCIDDDPAICEAIGARLSGHGIDVVQAFSGMQGYWTALESRPAVIITDLRMPDGEGNYICGRLKNHPLTQRTPIFVLTGETNPATRRQMLSLGVDAYLTKPVNWTELLRALRRHVVLPERDVELAAT